MCYRCLVRNPNSKNSRTWGAYCWTDVISGMTLRHWYSFFGVLLFLRSSLCSAARYTVVWFLTYLMNIVPCLTIFYAGHSSQNILTKRKEHPYSTRPHLLSSVDWICCVRTSRLKSYIIMAMDPTLCSFCCASQWICRRTTLNSPKLISVFVIPGLPCGISPNGSCGIYVHIIGFLQMH